MYSIYIKNIFELINYKADNGMDTYIMPYQFQTFIVADSPSGTFISLTPFAMMQDRGAKMTSNTAAGMSNRLALSAIKALDPFLLRLGQAK